MFLTYKTILSQKTQLTSDTYLYHFDLIEPKEINFKAGQYLILKIPSDKGPISRLYSIASSDTIKSSFELIIRIIPGGLASNYLSSMSENTEVIFQGPAGIFSLKENNRPKIFLVTGTGIAPILSIIKSNFQFSIFNFQLFWGLKSFQDVYLFNDLKQWSNETMEQFNFKICLSREQNLNMIPEVDKKFFELGHINSCFEKQFNNLTMEQLNNYNFYLCGGREIVESLKQFLLGKNILRENIYFEKF
jgi:Na+-transporting NADH:ubiquinone oxidoreductase subunit F